MKNSISNQDFKKILFYSKSLLVRDLLFYYKENKPGISFIVSRKLGKAILRNKFKTVKNIFFSPNYKMNNVLKERLEPHAVRYIFK